MLLLAVAFLFGAFIGSFLNVCIHRLPRNESVVMPPSRCYTCGTQVTWYDNLPLISYLVLRGKCRWCAAPFSIRYFALELLVAIVTAGIVGLAFVAHPPWVTAPWTTVMPQLLAQALAAAVLIGLVYYLVVSAFIDLEFMIIPDELTKSFQWMAPFLAVGAGLNLAYGWNPGAWFFQRDVFDQVTYTPAPFLIWMTIIGVGAIAVLLASLPLARYIYSKFCPVGQRWSADDHRGFRIGVLWYAAACILPLIAIGIFTAIGSPWSYRVSVHLAQALLGSLVGWFALYFVGLLGTVAFRRNAMGFGDVKFLAPIGAFLGPIGVLYVFFLAALFGSLIGIPLRLSRAAQREIPFGPYLALGALATIFIGPRLHHFLFG
jgi:leader peptidase (prepilin peptidase)/N-methyltransferase